MHGWFVAACLSHKHAMHREMDVIQRLNGQDWENQDSLVFAACVVLPSTPRGLSRWDVKHLTGSCASERGCLRARADYG